MDDRATHGILECDLCGRIIFGCYQDLLTHLDKSHPRAAAWEPESGRSLRDQVRMAQSIAFDREMSAHTPGKPTAD